METSPWAPTPNVSEPTWLNVSAIDFSTTFRPPTTNRQNSDGNVVLETGLIVPLYVVIFVLSVVGNSLVLITLARKKRMRTVTNVFLLNLAVSDLLLGVFCMPFTLLGQLLRNFVFGAAMCKLIPYFQAVSVSVGVWTLVAISLERYFAICRPLKSRRWQTRFHACKMIVLVWFASCISNSPILAVSTLQAMKYSPGRHKCREEWSSLSSERAYQLFLDVMLLLVPLLIMSVAYLLIVSKLWRGLRREIRHSSSFRRQPGALSGGVGGVVAAASVEPSSALLMAHSNGASPGASVPPLGTATLRHWSTFSGRKLPVREAGGVPPGRRAIKMWLHKTRRPAPASNGQIVSHQLGDLDHQLHQLNHHISHQHISLSHPRERSRILINGDICDGEAEMEVEVETGANECVLNRHAIRSNYMDKSIEAKKKVIRMLFVVVAEFFVCWAPIHVLNTWYLFSPDQVYASVGSTGISLVQLVAYVSSCCNPITYCFMNRKFRQAFLGVFSCRRCSSKFCGQSMTCDPGGGAATVGGGAPGEDYKDMRRRRGDPSGCPDEVDNVGDHSDNSINDSTVFAGRETGIDRSGESPPFSLSCPD